MATPSGVFKLRVMLRLLRCRLKKSGPCRVPPSPSSSESSGISTLLTSAPQSANWRTAVGPARARVRSITLKRDSGPLRSWTISECAFFLNTSRVQHTPAASHRQQDLAEMGVGAHVRQRRLSLIEREGAIDRQAQPASLDLSP